MTEITGTTQAGAAGRLRAFIGERRALLRDYLAAVSGSAGRLVFSLVYFLALANSLSLAEFGLFATASAAGLLLSRLLAFGFIAPLYRTATIRHRLVGLYTGGFILAGLASLPLIAVVAALVYALFFASGMTVAVFVTIIAAEVLLARPTEAVIIINNGMGRFGRGSILTVVLIAMRTIAALALYLAAARSLETWAHYYLAANVVSLVIACAFFFPRQRLRFMPRLYWRRLPDAIYAASSEVLFYLQMEFDKLIVLAFGGAQMAGLYAIIMRLVDLTAIPIRTFNMMLVQRVMKTPRFLGSIRIRVGIEAGVFVVSTLAILCLAVLLHFYPAVFGSNVAAVAPLVMLAVFIPGLRNLVEYQAELLFARGQTFMRATNLAVLTILKGALLVWLLSMTSDPAQLIAWLTPVFVLLYVVSATLTYRAMRRPHKRA